nr:fatty acyl-CoA synthetase [Ferroacidibacillus organovorans]
MHVVSLTNDVTASVRRARRNTLSDLLHRSRMRAPDRLALVYKDERLSYVEFDDRVNQTAWALSEGGVGYGTVTAVLSRNSMDFAVVNFALARLGAVMVPMNYMLTVTDLAYILQHSNVQVFLASIEFAEFLDQASKRSNISISNRYLMDTQFAPSKLAHWHPLGACRERMPTDLFESNVSDEDVAHILYTSGTESKPKGVMLTHANLVSEYVSTLIDGGMEARDVAIHALPLYHSAQLHGFLGPGIYIGSTGVILPGAAPDVILETIEQEKVTQLFCPPTVWIALLRHPDFAKRDLSSLEKCYYGAAIMPREVLKELSIRLPQAKFWNFYGQTEVAPLATVLKPEDQMRKIGSAGKPALNVETGIVDEDGREVPRGTMGEIVHRTSHAMLGYLHNLEKTAEAFQGGWFHSGDLGVMDEEGYITVVDRKKDMIKTGGVNVSSREVEEFLYTIDGVSEVAVIGVPDSYWIEAVTAVIVPKIGASLDMETIFVACKDHLSKFKVPKHIVLAEALPKNPSGKILKRELRETYQGLSKSEHAGS